MEQENLDLNKLLDDVREIKKAIKQNAYIFKKTFYSTAVKFAFFIAGAITLCVPFLYYIFIKHFGSYMAVPPELRLLLILFVAAGVVLSASSKLIFYIQAHHMLPGLSLFKTLSRLFSRQALALYPGISATIIFFVVFFVMRGDYHFIVPVLDIGSGLLFSMVGSFISLPELSGLGYFFWITGVVSIPFIAAAPLISLLWLSGTFGVGLLAFTFYLALFYRQDKEC